MTSPRRRPALNVTLSPSAIARLERLTEWGGWSSKSKALEDMIQREWIRVSGIDQAVADIHEVLDPLAGEPCANAPTGADAEDMMLVSDCGECPSCRARAALNMLDLEIVSAVGVHRRTSRET